MNPILPLPTAPTESLKRHIVWMDHDDRPTGPSKQSSTPETTPPPSTRQEAARSLVRRARSRLVLLAPR